MSARQIGPRGMTAFVPNGDSRKDTAVYLLAAAVDLGMDETRVVAAAGGGFFISDEFADALASYDPDVEEQPVDADQQPTTEEVEQANSPEGNPEAEKAVDQLETEVPPVPDAPEVVDAAVAPEQEGTVEKAKPKGRTKTSGNRAAKNTDSEEE